MLIVHCNDNFRPEREYIFDCIFNDFWQIDYELKYGLRRDIEIELDNGIRLRIADTFLQMNDNNWLSECSLPKQPLTRLTVREDYADCVTDRILPVIYGESCFELFSADNMYCTIDVFGSALFMLTRYEEVVKRVRDDLDRFSANESLAYQEGFLERPIINEYLEILWRWIKRHCQTLKRKKRQFSIMPTHDVDFPFWGLSIDWYHCLRMLMGDILKRRDTSLARKHFCWIINSAKGNFNDDPNNTFDRIMDISEEQNLISHFYFMTTQDRNVKDGNYDIMNPALKKLIRKILIRGHKIGIHPGFGSKDTFEFIKEDTENLRRLILAEKISVEKFGGRQHYLHWSAPDTWAYYEQAGIIYDTTLSYADHIGFRCGICYDYPVYNVKKHERYMLREYPLTVMECSGLAERYMNLSHYEMMIRCRAMKSKIEKYQGIFVVLWHNTSFINKEDIKCYQMILR